MPLEIIEIRPSKNADYVMLFFAATRDADGVIVSTKPHPFSAKTAEALSLQPGDKITIAEA
jgi:hypothetical protein